MAELTREVSIKAEPATIFPFLIDPDLQAAMVRAYNRWGAEMRATSGGRVHTAGPVPLGDVTRAIAEIEHAYHHLGIRAFWARPDEFNHRTLGDRYYDPVWELIQDLDVPFSTHEFMGLRGNSFGSDRFRGYSEWHTVVHPFEAMGAMVSMSTSPTATVARRSKKNCQPFS